MNTKKVSCELGLKKDVIKKDVFERESAICREYAQRDGKCCWGVCAKCGVPLLLQKFYKGILLEKPKEIEDLRNKFFYKK